VPWVYNFNLKDDASGDKFRVTYGQTAEGNGENTVVDGNIGLPLTDSGFINATFSYNNQSQTDNSNNRRRDDLVALGFNQPNSLVVCGRPKRRGFL